MSRSNSLSIITAVTTAIISIGTIVWMTVLTTRSSGTITLAPLIAAETCSVTTQTEHYRIVMLNFTSADMPMVIEPLQGILPSTIQILSSACNGVINSINFTTGQITYTPSIGEQQTIIDVFQYRALDSCGEWHVVTQSVCTQVVTIPPMFTENCYPEVLGSSSTAVRLLPNLGIVQGDNPIDWSTLEFISFDAFYENVPGSTNCVNTDEAQQAMLPWGTSQLNMPFSSPRILPAVLLPPALPGNTAIILSPVIPADPSSRSFRHELTHDNAGSIEYQQIPITSPEAISVAFRIRVQVSDTSGVVSNPGVVYYFYEFFQGNSKK